MKAEHHDGYIHPMDKKPSKRAKRTHDGYHLAEKASGADASADNTASVYMIDSGAMGAFVHGLEDEFSEVRQAAISSIQSLAVANKLLSRVALELLVDMVNDEIIDVRINAVKSVGVILEDSPIPLKDDQLNVVLSGLHGQSLKIRTALHEVISGLSLTSTLGLHTCISALLGNLKRYPHDSHGVYGCLAELGKRHPFMCELLVEDLLSLNNAFLPPEPKVEQAAYIAKLVLVFHAASSNHVILALLPAYCHRHYTYLTRIHPSHFPCLSLSFVGAIPCVEGEWASVEDKPVEYGEDSSSTLLSSSLMAVDGVRVLWEQEEFDKADGLIKAAKKSLRQLGGSHVGLKTPCEFHKEYLQCLYVLTRMLQARLSQRWVFDESKSHSLPAKLLLRVHRISSMFDGLKPVAHLALYQMRIAACALMIIESWDDFDQSKRTVHTSDLTTCLLGIVSDAREFSETHKLKQPSVLLTLTGLTSAEKNSKCPIVSEEVFKALQADLPTLSSLDTEGMKMSNVTLRMSPSSLERPVKCLAHLPHQLRIDGTVQDTTLMDSLALRVFSPDQSITLYPLNQEVDFTPSKKHPEKFTLKTKLRICHGAWNGSGALKISLMKMVVPMEAPFFELIRVSTNVQLCDDLLYHLVFRPSVK